MLLKYKHPSLPYSSLRRQKSANCATSRVKALLLLSLIFTSSITTLPIIQSTDASALSMSSSDPRTYNEQIKSILYYKSISYCLKNSELSNWFDAFGIGQESISNQDATNGKWFTSGVIWGQGKDSVTSGVYMIDSIGGMDKRGF